MLTTAVPGQFRRQWLFFAFLFMPIFALMFILGVAITREANILIPLAITAGIIAIIASIVTMGINWRIGLYLMMFFVLWDRLLSFGAGGGINATKIAIGLTIIYMLTAMFNGQLPGWGKRLLDPLPFTAILFIAISAFSVIFMPHPDLATSFISRRFNIVVIMIILMIGITNREVFHRAILFLVLGGTLVAIVTLSEPITGVGLLERMGKANPEIGSGIAVLQTYRGAFRIIGPSGGPNFYGLAQSLPAVLAFGLFLYYRPVWKKVLLFLALSVMAFNIIGTGSRSGAAGFIAGVIFVFLLCPVKHRFIKMAVALSLLVASVLILVALDTNVAANRIADPGGAATPALQRIAMWEMAINMFTNYPFTGVGTNGWAYYYPYYRIPPIPERLLRTHNSFMQMLAECGIAGVVSYLMLFVFAGLNVFSAALATRDRRFKFEAMAIASILIGFFTFAGTQNVLEHELYFIVFGLCGAAYNVYRREVAERNPLGVDFLRPDESARRITALAARQQALYPPGT